MANIVGEKKNIHHSIVNGLDSHDALEVDAAVYAVDRFSAISRLISLEMHFEILFNQDVFV